MSLTLASLSLDHWPVLVILTAVVLLSRPGPEAGWWRRRLVPLLVFAGLAGAWSLWEIHAYGKSHFWSNLHLRAGGAYPWRAALLPAVFLAGGLPFIAVGWAYLVRRSRTAAGALLLLAVAVWALFTGPLGGFTRLQGAFLSVELATGLAFLISLVYLWKERSDATDHLLIGWFLVEFLFVQRFLAYPSGHHLLMLALPAALVSARMAGLLRWSPKTKYAGCLAMAVLTLSLAAADQEEAAIGPKLARDVSGFSGPRYYWGNDFSGFSYYLKAAGWKAFDPRTQAKSGDLILVPRNLNVPGTSAVSFRLRVSFDRHPELPIAVSLRTLSLGDAAGWYSASWGALPWSFSSAPAETFFIYLRK